MSELARLRGQIQPYEVIGDEGIDADYYFPIFAALDDAMYTKLSKATGSTTVTIILEDRKEYAAQVEHGVIYAPAHDLEKSLRKLAEHY
jgi:hypothetical protein